MEKTTDRPDKTTDADSVAPARSGNRPDPAWIRGKCPNCGDDVVSNLYYLSGHRYTLVWECWSSLAETPTCEYRRSV